MPKTVYLTPKELRTHSRHHTHYAGDGAIVAPGQPGKPLHRLVFVNGKATNVDEATYKRFKDLGCCDVNKPSDED